jgi:hypothetical protein
MLTHESEILSALYEHLRITNFYLVAKEHGLRGGGFA